MHDDIVRFERQGYTNNNAQSREWQVFDLEREMRYKGFVPSIDNEPQYTVEFDKEHGGFYFTLSVYGVKVGKEEAWQISGVTNGKMISKHSAPHRSSQS